MTTPRHTRQKPDRRPARHAADRPAGLLTRFTLWAGQLLGLPEPPVLPDTPKRDPIALSGYEQS